MFYKKFLASLMVLAASAVFAGTQAFADSESETVPREVTVPYACAYESPEEITYDAEVVAVNRKMRVEKDELFRVKVFVKNLGNTPWFSHSADCAGPTMYLGTDKPRDRASQFYTPDVEEGMEDNWVSANRIQMDQDRVEPNEIASFTFWSDAGDEDEIYKEFFTPVIEGAQWIDHAQTSFGVVVGESDEVTSDVRTKILYGNESGTVSQIDLDAEKTLTLDRSDQRLFVKLGDYVVREMVVSSGGPRTPTPIGETTITLKQRVRIGGAAPHYIMPNFMWFRAGGYGFHALPSQGSAAVRREIRAHQARGEEVPPSLYQDDVFWTEALDHIGIPVSHGCIRMLPVDSDFLFEFAEIGTRVIVMQ